MTTVRAAEAEDIPAISRLLVAVAAGQITHEFTAEGTEALLGGMRPRAIAKRMASGYRYYVASDNGRLAGVIGMRGYSHVYHLFVAESAQRQGIGRQLWQRARQASLEDVRLTEFTVYSSRYAEGFYRALGFKRTGNEQTRHGVTAIPMKLIMEN